jgi:hypothetical protein
MFFQFLALISATVVWGSTKIQPSSGSVYEKLQSAADCESMITMYDSALALWDVSEMAEDFVQMINDGRDQYLQNIENPFVASWCVLGIRAALVYLAAVNQKKGQRFGDIETFLETSMKSIWEEPELLLTSESYREAARFGSELIETRMMPRLGFRVDDDDCFANLRHMMVTPLGIQSAIANREAEYASQVFQMMSWAASTFTQPCSTPDCQCMNRFCGPVARVTEKYVNTAPQSIELVNCQIQAAYAIITGVALPADCKGIIPGNRGQHFDNCAEAVNQFAVDTGVKRK